MQRSLFAVAAAGVGLAAVLMSGTANAQDLRGSPPLPVFPQIYETSEQKIRVVEGRLHAGDQVRSLLEYGDFHVILSV